MSDFKPTAKLLSEYLGVSNDAPQCVKNPWGGEHWIAEPKPKIPEPHCVFCGRELAQLLDQKKGGAR